MIRSTKITKRWLAISLVLFGLVSGAGSPLTNLGQVSGQGFPLGNSCSGGGGTTSSSAGTLIALTVNNTLLNVNPATPNVINSVRGISGLSSGETIIAIDYRPANGQLYGLSDTGRVYTLNADTGAATLVSTAALNPALSGTRFGFDFNPAADRIRLVSNTGQDLRLNPLTGAVAATDTNLTFSAGDTNSTATPNIVSIAYTNSSAGVTSTTLYGIDANLNALVTQGSVNGTPTSPNTGQLFTIGALGVDTTELAGFDIAPGGNAAFASLTTQGAGASQLYTINLTTGAATLVGTIGGGALIRDIAFIPRTENVYVLTSNNRILVTSSGTPGTATNTLTITGLAGSEKVVSIDFRPGTGQLFAVTDASRIYVINLSTGVATQVGTAAFTPAATGVFGIDFNPSVDRIRLVGGAGQNLRINPVTGAVAATDTNLVFAAGDPNASATPNASAAAYSNNFVGSTGTTLYVIDTTLNALLTQGSVGGTTTSPNTGQLFTVGPLGVDPTGVIGFDISSNSGAAFATFTVAGSTTPQLYSINLTTGAATLVGTVGQAGTLSGGETVLDVAVGLTAPNVYAVTASNQLVTLMGGTPGTITSSRQITGLASGENIVGLDFRPATGQLFAISSTGRIFTIDPTTGIALQVGSAPLNPALSGTNFGFNFNPVVDRIRLVSNTGQDLRLNPLTGTVAATDTNLIYATGDINASATPNVVAVAYNNSFFGSTTTTLYGIDAALGTLVTQGSVGGSPTSPNTGQLFTIGSLGVPVSGRVGFDIVPFTNAGILSITAPGATTSQLYSVNLATGAATLIGAVGVNETLTALTVANPTGTAQNGTPSTVFCLQDDRNGDILQINTCTGDYQFTRCGTGGFTLVGRASVSRVSGGLQLRDNRLNATFNTSLFNRRVSGNATIRVTPFGSAFTIDDSGTSDNTCTCRQ
ncbi:MAG: DUF4394 domain-containing protein [Acidobacteriota bacterium]